MARIERQSMYDFSLYNSVSVSTGFFSNQFVAPSRLWTTSQPASHGSRSVAISRLCEIGNNKSARTSEKYLQIGDRYVKMLV